MIVAGLAPIVPPVPTVREKEKTGFDALDDNQKVSAINVANSFIGARYQELGIEPVEGAVPPSDLFPPATDVPQLIENGYMDDQGNITPKGDTLVALKNAGLVNEDNTLNASGLAVITPKEVALRQENLDIFRVREKMELDTIGAGDQPFVEKYLAPLGESVAKIPSAVGSIIDLNKEPEDVVAATEAFGGVVKQTAQLVTQLSGMAFADPLIRMTTEDDEQELALAARRQDAARQINEIEKVNGAEALEKAFGFTNAVSTYNDALSKLTPEQKEEAEKVGAAGTLAIQLINPLGPEALVFKTAAAAGKAAFAPVSRSVLHAEKAAASYSAAQKRLYSARNAMAHMASVAERGPQRAAFFERQADKLSSAGNLERSATIRKAAQDIRERVQRATLRSTDLADEVANLERVVPGLEKAAMSGEYLLKAQNAARQLTRVPSEVIGVPLQAAGQTLMGIDRGLKFLSQKVGLGKAYDYINRASTLGLGGGIAAASGLGPMAFVPAAIKSTLAMGPVLNATGKLVRTLGVEGAKVRGSIPYWNRVAQATVNPKTKILANRMSEIFWGLGKFNQLTRGAIPGAARGAVAGFPVDLGFEYIYSGGNLNWDTIKNAAAESLVIGSSGGAMGAASVSTRDKLINVHNNDAINFYQNLADPEQRVMFNTLRPEMKRIIGNASASYPGLNINITRSGAGSFDPNTYTVNINPFSSNPLAPLFSHEVNHYIANRTGMEPVISTMLVGDGVQSGGLLRSADGTLDPDFEKWGNEYNRRLRLQHEREVSARIAAGEKLTPTQKEFKPLNLNQLANEYFVEVNSEEFIGMVEEGKLTQVIQRPESVKKLIALADSLIDKSTILRDLHFKIGGMMDTNGRTVMGSGLLADGIKQLPQVRKMYRDMVTDTAGLPAHTRKVSRKEQKGIVIPETGPQDPIYDEMWSNYETDEFGQVIRDEKGVAIPLSPEKDFARSQAGLVLIENAMARSESGQQVDGELKFNPSEDSWIGRFLTDEQVKIIADSGMFNPKQIRNLRMMNEVARDQAGKRFLTIYQPALEKRRGKRAVYKPQEKTMREIVPFGIRISSQGNILVELMSVNQLNANVMEMAAKRQGLKLYNGDPEAIMGDVLEVIRLHGDGKSADEYFKSKPEYSTDWSQRKNFINAVFGAVGRGQADFNPVLNSIKATNGVVKTYRLDRMNKTVDLDGNTVLPYNNNLVRINFLPEGEPIVDADNNIVERGVPSSEAMMPEADIPVAKTSDEALQESESGDLKSTGIDVPEYVDEQSVISSATKVANSQSWRKGRDFKLEIQRRVLDAAENAGVNISERNLESIEYLARVGLKDALIALDQNPNAIGWYDEKTKQALEVMSLLFPEIATDENARFAFTWALAVTSNGLKVDKNFELAERVYRAYRKTGKMPTDIKAGQAQQAINEGLGLFNTLTKEWEIENTRKFMQTNFTVGEISKLNKDLSPGGEFSDTVVRGSSILGPKIGNGFFSNLYGLFDALTMDRWLVRTWGRWTGTLVELNPELTQNAKIRLEEALSKLTDSDKSRMDKVIGKDISQITTEELSVAIQKASMKPRLRDEMNRTTTGEEFRKAGNGLAKYLDGQKEAPANPAERNFIREIFGLMLDELRSDPKYRDLTMADLQAVLWYAEKRLYETAKVKSDQDSIDQSDTDGYEDDEAPDYANAAIGVARNKGVSDKRINEVLTKIKNERTAITRPTIEEGNQAAIKQQESAGGFTSKQKQKFKQYVSVSRVRRNRNGNEKALWSYQTRSGVDSGNAGLLKPRLKKNLGIKYVAEWKPGRKLSNTFRNNDLPVVKFLEIDQSDLASAQKFSDAIQQSKNESAHGAAVYVYPVNEYQGMRLFLSDSGKSGFAVKPDGDIVSVFSMEKGSGRSIMEAAISAGGKKLDAFDTVLPEFYGTHGFVEAARLPWNDEFAPEGWNKETFKKFNNGEPDVVMMVLDPSFEGEYKPRKDIYATDYDQAVTMQEKMIKSFSSKTKKIKKSKTTGNALDISDAVNLK